MLPAWQAQGVLRLDPYSGEGLGAGFVQHVTGRARCRALCCLPGKPKVSSDLEPYSMQFTFVWQLSV